LIVRCQGKQLSWWGRREEQTRSDCVAVPLYRNLKLMECTQLVTKTSNISKTSRVHFAKHICIDTAFQVEMIFDMSASVRYWEAMSVLGMGRHYPEANVTETRSVLLSILLKLEQ
jgi:hypothetical protein